MRQGIGIGVVAAASALAMAVGCQKNGEAEMRPASGVNPDYENRGYQQPHGEHAPSAPVREPPTPGSGSGIPGTETTPGTGEPGTGTGAGLHPSGEGVERTRDYPMEESVTPTDPSTTGPTTTGGAGGQSSGGGGTGGRTR